MSASDKPGISESDAILQARFRLSGIIILFVGLLAAILINGSAASRDAGISDDTKKYERQMEMLAGKGNMLATEMREGFVSLWQGRRLARTLLFLSVGGSAACFFVAHRLGFPPPPDTRSGGSAR